jgi:hypothetical protein
VPEVSDRPEPTPNSVLFELEPPERASSPIVASLFFSVSTLLAVCVSCLTDTMVMLPLKLLVGLKNGEPVPEVVMS